MVKRLLLTLILIAAAAAALLAAESTDNFDTDPTGRWTVQSGSWTWDSANGEMDILTSSASLQMFRYNTPPGGLDHEAQVTFLTGPDEFSHRTATPMVRHPAGQGEGYFLRWNLEENFVQILRYNNGIESDVEDAGFVLTIGTTTWWTVRIAAEGGVGDPVTISVWYQNHGATKPSDPGWIGDDNNPDQVFVDTDANRLDDATHVYCGIAGRNATDWDTRHDYYKQRLISDRGGVEPPPPSLRQILLPLLGVR